MLLLIFKRLFCLFHPTVNLIYVESRSTTCAVRSNHSPSFSCNSISSLSFFLYLSVFSITVPLSAKKWRFFCLSQSFVHDVLANTDNALMKSFPFCVFKSLLLSVTLKLGLHYVASVLYMQSFKNVLNILFDLIK